MAEPSCHINPDLQKERDGATFDTEELACLIYGGPEGLAKKRKLEHAAYSDPDYKSVPLAFLSREEEYEEGLRRSVLALMKRPALGDLVKDIDDMITYNRYNIPVNALFDLSIGMFAPTLIGQGTEEQKEKWLIPALKHEIIGTYAQTEMGHGTFLRGLETTSTYDPSTQEFILNSPTVTSTKWWPGAMGKTSTHAIVLAQLYTRGKCHGIHPFVVQLRSMEDHTSLPGITVGDIGPKFGYGAMDNGFLKLNNVRIPRGNMLMKHSQVAPDGTYSHPPSSKLTYGTMTFVRSTIVKGSAIALAMGTTIAVRYSAVRRQSELRPGEPEPQVLSYPTQQHKLLPLLATAYAFHFVQVTMMQTYHAVNKQVAAGNFSRTQELHGLSSGLKAFTSWVANAGLEVLRMSCGGHGYSLASGFGKMYGNFTPACTYEGENTVMMLQSARYLIKCVRNAKSKEGFHDSIAYLATKQDLYKQSRDFLNLDFLENLYMQRAYNFVHFASSKVDAAMKQGIDLVSAINSAAVFLVSAASAHSHYFIVKNMNDNLKSMSVSAPLRRALHELGLLYALDGIEKSSGEFLQDGVLSGDEAKLVRQCVVDLLPAIRTNAVALVDAFGFRDEQLQSVLGRYDGNVYENLFKWAQDSKLNKTDVHPTYHKYLRPLLKRNQAKL